MPRPRRQKKVVSLFGAALPLPQVDEGVMEAIADLDQMARSGRISGIAYAIVAPQGHWTTGWAGKSDGVALVGAGHFLAARLTKALDNQS